MAPNPTKSWLKRLQQRFSPRRIRLGNDGGKPLPGGAGNALACIVGRELCLFCEVDAIRVPEKQRPALVELAVRRAAPFADPEFRVAWSPGGHAGVWYWSRGRVQDLLGPQPVRRVEFQPEALYVGAPRDCGAELLQLSEGLEGRIWEQGGVVASRWWSQPPSLQEWSAFLRGAGHMAGTAVEVPEAQPVVPTERSWAGQRRREVRLLGLGVLWPKAALAFGVVATVLLAFELGALVRAHLDIQGARATAGVLDESLQRILSARERADRDLAGAAALLALRPPRQQTELMAEVARLMPGAEWRLKHWLQPVPDRLEVTVLLSAANPEQLVATWEASPMFEDVTIGVAGRDDEMTLKATVVPASGTLADAEPTPETPAGAP